MYLQPFNLETERSVKISKSVLGKPKDNLWVALVFFMKEMESVLYLIINNDQGERFSHLSNWEGETMYTTIAWLSWLPSLIVYQLYLIARNY